MATGDGIDESGSDEIGDCDVEPWCFGADDGAGIPEQGSSAPLPPTSGSTMSLRSPSSIASSSVPTKVSRGTTFASMHGLLLSVAPLSLGLCSRDLPRWRSLVMRCKHRLPGFRTTCLIVGVLDVLLGGSILARGVGASMTGFGVPDATLASPHYIDAIWWVYSHMIVIGLMLIVVGQLSQSISLRRWFARLMSLAHAYYTVLDVRASDSVLGDALYQGPRSIGPAVIAGVMTLMFAHLSLCTESRGTVPDP